MLLIVMGLRAHPVTNTSPECVCSGSGASTSPWKSNVCATIADAHSATTVRTRPRVTHRHITPTSNPSVLGELCLKSNNRREFILAWVSSPNVNTGIDLADVAAAAARIGPWVHRTPL